MKCLRLPFLIALVLASTTIAVAQKQQCAVAQAPQFRGFYLGMTALEVRGKLEDTTLFDLNSSNPKAGSQAVRISAAELKESLAEGIDEINLAFVDGKLALIKVSYVDGSAWDNAQDFLLKVSTSLGMPKPGPANTTGNGGNEKYRVECSRFAVALAYSFGNSPNFTINDMAAQRLADQRLKDEGEVRRVVINPGGTTTRRP